MTVAKDREIVEATRAFLDAAKRLGDVTNDVSDEDAAAWAVRHPELVAEAADLLGGHALAAAARGFDGADA